MNLWQEILDNIARVEATLSQLKRYGKELAHAESDYKIALAKEMLRLKEQGEKVTIMRDLCYGTPHIAKLRLERDIAEVLHRSCLEGINVFKLKLRILESQYEREWGSTK
jgi:hypothetical protein